MTAKSTDLRLVTTSDANLEEVDQRDDELEDDASTDVPFYSSIDKEALREKEYKSFKRHISKLKGHDKYLADLLAQELADIRVDLALLKEEYRELGITQWLQQGDAPAYRVQGAAYKTYTATVKIFTATLKQFEQLVGNIEVEAEKDELAGFMASKKGRGSK